MVKLTEQGEETLRDVVRKENAEDVLLPRENPTVASALKGSTEETHTTIRDLWDDWGKERGSD